MSSRLIRWLCGAALLLILGVYLVGACFGLKAPLWWGHDGYNIAVYMLRARMTMRHHMLSPANWTGYDTPPSNAIYFHHPIGFHYVLLPFVLLFGEHEWVARSLGIATCLINMAALYALVARFWSRPAAVLAIATFVTLPIMASYGAFCDAMFLEMTAVFLLLRSYLIFLERPTPRALLFSTAAIALGGIMMWEIYFISVFLGMHALLYLCTKRGRSLRIGILHAPLAHLLVTAAACAFMMGLHLFLTYRSGTWKDFLESYAQRSAPPSPHFVIERHQYWMELLYGVTPVLVGAAWFVGWLGRLATKRGRRRDLAPLTFLFINTLYIYLFAEGSSVHLYRVFFYSGFFVLATVDLASDLWSALRALLSSLGLKYSTAGALAAVLFCFGVYLWNVVPHAYSNLLESRAMMGTHGQAGYSPQRERTQFFIEVAKRTQPHDRVILMRGQLTSRKELWFYLDRSLDEIDTLAQVRQFSRAFGHSVLMCDESTLSTSDHRIFEDLLAHHPVWFFNQFAMVDLRSNSPTVQSFAFVDAKVPRSYLYWVSRIYAPLITEKRVYWPGVCAALAHGVPIDSSDKAPAVDNSPHSLACAFSYFRLRRDQPQMDAMKKRLVGTAAARDLGPAHLYPLSASGGRQLIAIFVDDPAAADFHYVRQVAARPAQNLASTAPSPRDWRAGFAYLDAIPLTALSDHAVIEAELSEKDRSSQVRLFGK